MQVHSIISNTIPEEVLRDGHLAVRFLSDGFTLLLEDGMYTPLLLKKFSSDPHLSLNHYIDECETWLDNHSLLGEFTGETTIMPKASSCTFIPEELHSDDHEKLYLQQAARLGSGESISSRKIKLRPFYITYNVARSIETFSEKFGGPHRIIHPAECLLSVSDQINASDHQRGFVLIEVQSEMMEILVIRDDMLMLSNRYSLKAEQDAVYHVLNTIRQLDLDRKSIPLYYTGILNGESEAFDLLKGYVTHLRPLPYFIREIDKAAIPGNAILAESTKCE